MPDDEYKMTDEERQRADEWMKSKWPKEMGRCVMCGHTEWHAQDNFGLIPLLKKGKLSLGSGFPVLVVICSNCGHMVFVNAMVAGILREPEEGPSDAE